MKKYIVGLIAGLLLGVTGTGVAATQGYWSESGTGYKCEGVANGVICKSGGYQVGVTKDYVFVARGSSKTQMFGCEKYTSWYSCFNGTTP